MDELCDLLANFHISQRLANEAALSSSLSLASTTPNPTTTSPKAAGKPSRSYPDGYRYDHAVCRQDANCIPFWQPPSLAYSQYIPILEAESELNSLPNNRPNLEQRVWIVDRRLEYNLLSDYVSWTSREWDAAFHDGCYEGGTFMRALFNDIHLDLNAVRAEMSHRIQMYPHESMRHVYANMWKYAEEKHL